MFRINTGDLRFSAITVTMNSVVTLRVDVDTKLRLVLVISRGIRITCRFAFNVEASRGRTEFLHRLFSNFVRRASVFCLSVTIAQSRTRGASSLRFKDCVS